VTQCIQSFNRLLPPPHYVFTLLIGYAQISESRSPFPPVAMLMLET